MEVSLWSRQTTLESSLWSRQTTLEESQRRESAEKELECHGDAIRELCEVKHHGSINV